MKRLVEGEDRLQGALLPPRPDDYVASRTDRLATAHYYRGWRGFDNHGYRGSKTSFRQPPFGRRFFSFQHHREAAAIVLDHPSSLTHAKARLEADPQYQPWSMAVSRPHITGIGGVPRAAPTKSIEPSLHRCWCKNSAEIEIRDRAGSATPRIRQPAGRTG